MTTNFWAALSWFAVDICLLALTVSATVNLPSRARTRPTSIVAWYLCLSVILVAAGFCYMFFIKRCVEKAGVGPFKE
jgi:hypothetical protein